MEGLLASDNKIVQNWIADGVRQYNTEQETKLRAEQEKPHTEEYQQNLTYALDIIEGNKSIDGLDRKFDKSIDLITIVNTSSQNDTPQQLNNPERVNLIVDITTANHTISEITADEIIATILATSFRTDAWLLPFIFSFLLLLKKRLKEALVFLFFSSLYILTSFYLWHRYSNIYTLGVLEIKPHNLLFNLFHCKAFFGNCRIFANLKILFDRFSIPLSILGFLGMPNALENKKQHVILISFCVFFAMISLFFIFSTKDPLQRYSYIFSIFFIPFIFQGINRIVLNIRRIFSLNDFYKKALFISLSVIASLYFIFFSVRLLIKELPNMKYAPLIYDLSDWAQKNINSGDIIITPFFRELWVATVSNKFIDKSSRLYDFIDSKKEYKLSKKIIDEIATFSNYICGPTREDRFYIGLLMKRGQPQEAKRIVLILNERSYALLRDNFPGLIKEIGIKYNGIFYTCVLPLYDT